MAGVLQFEQMFPTPFEVNRVLYERNRDLDGDGISMFPAPFEVNRVLYSSKPIVKRFYGQFPAPFEVDR